MKITVELTEERDVDTGGGAWQSPTKVSATTRLASGSELTSQREIPFGQFTASAFEKAIGEVVCLLYLATKGQAK